MKKTISFLITNIIVIVLSLGLAVPVYATGNTDSAGSVTPKVMGIIPSGSTSSEYAFVPTDGSASVSDIIVGAYGLSQEVAAFQYFPYDQQRDLLC